MHFSLVINCAGPWAGEIAEMAGIGTGQGGLSVPLPVEPRLVLCFGHMTKIFGATIEIRTTVPLL